jgi:hypothetical protein
MSKEEQDPEYSDSYSEFPNDYDYEADVYHWELGTTDNILEIEIIYQDSSPCGL